jgi:transposase-like protein
MKTIIKKCPFCKKGLQEQQFAGETLYICDPCGNNFRLADLDKLQKEIAGREYLIDRPSYWKQRNDRQSV